MKIETLQGTIDTNNLPDVDAMIMEKTEELRALCEKTGYTCILATEQRRNSTLSVACVADDEKTALTMMHCIITSIKSKFRS